MMIKTAQAKVPITNDETEAVVPTVADDGGGFGFFKALTVTLVVAALAIFAFYFYSAYGAGSPEEPFKVPDNAPVPGQLGLSLDPSKPLYEQDIPMQSRNAQKSREAQTDADRQTLRGNLQLAATRYKDAFTYDPKPELSLRLGEVYWQTGKTEEARNWWMRHLNDAPNSKARPYIEQTLRNAGSLPIAPH
jgi:tetratricopeptide (TPR) repeat protein